MNADFARLTRSAAFHHAGFTDAANLACLLSLNLGASVGLVS
ncbi:hypothetical protein SBBP2_1940008 [Burkholderiales bacterium]|nr:hypothetical protein SBBP2_1940008 [Burkholderiales bacterium]